MRENDKSWVRKQIWTQTDVYKRNDDYLQKQIDKLENQITRQNNIIYLLSKALNYEIVDIPKHIVVRKINKDDE